MVFVEELSQIFKVQACFTFRFVIGDLPITDTDSVFRIFGTREVIQLKIRSRDTGQDTRFTVQIFVKTTSS